jgi:hypothetical protein
MTFEEAREQEASGFYKAGVYLLHGWSWTELADDAKNAHIRDGEAITVRNGRVLCVKIGDQFFIQDVLVDEELEKLNAKS